MRQPDIDGVLFVVMLDQHATPEMLGSLPFMLEAEDPRPAAVQFNERYKFGGWMAQDGFKMLPHGALKYPGDPPMHPLGVLQLRDEVVLFYPHAYVAILQKDGSFEAARMD